MSLAGPSAPPQPTGSQRASPARPTPPPPSPGEAAPGVPTVPLVGFDIETDTTAGGLDPDTAAIVAVAVSVSWAPDPGEPARSPDRAATGAPGCNPPTREEVLTGTESEIIRGVDELLATVPPGYLVTWNGAAFDLPFVARRAEICGLGTGLDLSEDPSRRSRREPDRPAVRGRWHDLVHLDGYLLYRADVGASLGISCGLKPLARLVGMTPVELDQSRLHLASEEAIAEYVASDARTAVELVKRRWPQAAGCADGPLPPVRR